MKLQSLFPCFRTARSSALTPTENCKPGQKTGRPRLNGSHITWPLGDARQQTCQVDAEALIPPQPNFPAPGWHARDDKGPAEGPEDGRTRRARVAAHIKALPLRLFCRSSQSQQRFGVGASRPVVIGPSTAALPKHGLSGATMTCATDTARQAPASPVSHPQVRLRARPAGDRETITGSSAADDNRKKTIFDLEIAAISSAPPPEPVPDYAQGPVQKTLWFPETAMENRAARDTFVVHPAAKTENDFRLPLELRQDQADFEAILRPRRRFASAQAHYSRMPTIPEEAPAQIRPRTPMRSFESLSGHRGASAGLQQRHQGAEEQRRGLPIPEPRRWPQQDDATLYGTSSMLTPSSSEGSLASIGRDAPMSGVDERQPRRTPQPEPVVFRDLLAETVASQYFGSGTKPVRRRHVQPGIPVAPRPLASGQPRSDKSSAPEPSHTYRKGGNVGAKPPKRFHSPTNSAPKRRAEKAVEQPDVQATPPLRGAVPFRTYMPVETEIFDV
ncbi:hypothetical protein [Martelella sp. HB161492]|uniref:hypothetical protein n=1 Tax=Martelella sp. HB161492 TaxID=2720726 RepID=UPI00158FAFEC|nr:hypothetical protein [Martelella sp. HB161492]